MHVWQVFGIDRAETPFLETYVLLLISSHDTDIQLCV